MVSQKGKAAPDIKKTAVNLGEIMAEEKKNGIVVKNEHNEFELALRFLGNELIAIKMAATNFSGKLIVWSILLLLFSFMILEVFGLSAYFGVH